MGFSFDGYVLRPPRLSPVNAQETAEPSTGVLRHVQSLPFPAYDLQAPDFVDVRADQYRTAVLEAPGTSPTEYLVWAANTGQLAMLDDPSWWTEEGEGLIPTGEETVGAYTDGSTRVIVSDGGGRTLGSIIALVLARGDVTYEDEGWVDEGDPTQGRLGTTPYITVILGSQDYSAASGVVNLTRDTLIPLAPYNTDPVLTVLGGGLSKERGDAIQVVRYTVAPAKFWWTRNDRYETRFGWNGSTQRWEPYKGSSVMDLGILQPGTTYKMTPRVKNLPINSYLPGDPGDPDGYSMIRVGSTPSGTPVGGILIRPNAEVEGDYDFSLNPAINGIMGQTSGTLQFSPAFLTQNAGKTLWYSYKGFAKDSDGLVGKLQDALTDPLYVAPIPGPTDFPLLRIGSRRYLDVTLVTTDALLAAPSDPSEGEVRVSLATGKLRFSLEDVRKADPRSAYFDKGFFGEDVVYDGVALNRIPQPTTKPVALVDANGAVTNVGAGNLYIPGARLLPTEFADATDGYRGLGISGIYDTPDGTGAIPAYPADPATVRPGGDTLGTDHPGRIRKVEDGFSDIILFGKPGALVTSFIVDRDSDLPFFLKVKESEAYISREPTTLVGGGWGSVVRLGRQDRSAFGGEPLYFLQPHLTPASYTEVARIYSRSRDIFRFSGTQKLYFAIDGVSYTWTAPTAQGYYTATEVATDLLANSVPALPAGAAYAQNGRIVLEAADPSSGTVEIGWGGTTKDLSGAQVLGFLPGWRVQGGVPNWLPDSGASLGLFRSPVNLDRQNAIPDTRAESRVEDVLLVESVQKAPFVFMTYPPLQDVAGYDEDVFFNLRTTLVEGESVQVVNQPLVNYQDIIHRFGQKRFDWVQRGAMVGVVETALSTLPLGHSAVVPESLLGAPGIGGGFYLSEDGGAVVPLEADRDYILPQDGLPGVAQAVNRYGTRSSYGARGQFVAGGTTFTDPDADFSPVQPGYRLKILTTGNSAGSYFVQSVASTTTVVVSPPFPATPSAAVVWEMFEGYPDTVYDPSLVADQVYREFNHLLNEPFKVRLLSYLGAVPTDAGAQVASRLKANMAAALESGRNISLRYGLAAGTSLNTVSLVALTQTDLGILANGTLGILDTGTARFASGSFSVRVGTRLFTHNGTDLRPVATFTPTFAGGIEYLTAASSEGPKGRLKFGSDVLTDYASAQVYYVEEFQPPVDLGSLTAEYDPNTGYLNLSASDLSGHAGEKVYFVEQMITEQKRDVSLAPLIGSFSFNAPVPLGAAVEASYYRSDLEGRKVGNLITEFLPTFIRDEGATRVGHNVYTFNPDKDTIDQDIEPVVYIGPIQQNFGKTDYLVDYPASLGGMGRLTFVSHSVPDYVDVQVSYAVYEARGGEKSYDASQRLIYRPPFFIKANQNRFGLRGDRAAEFQAGQMLRIGADCFYIKNTKYYPSDGVTAVYIFPPTVGEVGSRAPGNDIVSVITAGSITTVVDPDGDAPVPTTAPAGFMSALDIDQFPFEPVSRGQKEITFSGNLTQYAVPGHVFEIGGCPFTISQVELSDDGTRTKISVTASFQTGFNTQIHPTVKLSYRPAYPPGVREFLGLGPLVADEGYEVVLFDGTNPGRTLAPQVEYTIDQDTGGIRLMDPAQAPLAAGERLLLSHTRLRVLQPFLANGVVANPRYYAGFLYGSFPSTENGYLGAQVTGTYTFRNPDTFYFRAVRLPSYLAEAAEQAVKEITSKQPAGGAQLPAGGFDNWDLGRLGIKGERRNLTDKDRAARTFLDFYNQTIEAFEQVNETISGGLIGDRDGKFRFFVGHGKEWFTPGYEDAISGDLQIRNVWSEVFNEANPNLDVQLIESDWVVDPRSADMVDGALTGWLPGSGYLDDLMTRQETLIHNDVDDEVLIRTGGKQTVWDTPRFYTRAKGVFAQMYDPHRFSRLFPTLTRAFTITAPGVGGDPNSGDFGVYTWGRFIDGDFQRTYGTTIGQLQNPVLGEIGQVSTATLSKRYSRGRVWAYLPEGLPANVFTGGTLPAAPLTRPVIIAFPALLRDIPVDPGTGFPDDAQLLSQGGGIPDAVAGDPDLAVPGFSSGDQIHWGQPDGTLYDLYTPASVTVFKQSRYTGVLVEEVLFGCVLTLMDANGTAITDPSQILAGTAPNSGVPLDTVAEQGDTVFAGPLTGNQDVAAGDTLDFQTVQEMAGSGGDYRTGVDITVKSDGRLVDITLPSFSDPYPFGLKEMTGQNPPSPMTPLEGVVEFAFMGQNPLRIPALTGNVQDDSGDYQIPYLNTGNTELDRFDEIGSALPHVLAAVDGVGGEPVYPDEELGNDGSVVGAIGGVFLESEPATLLTEQADVLRWAHTADPGTGDVAPYDLLLIEVGTPMSTLGATGIHSIGAAAYDAGGPGSLIEPPRFPTYTANLDMMTKVAAEMRYVFENYAVYVDPASPVYAPDPQAVIPAPPGVEVIEDTATNEVILEFQSVGFPVFHDGFVAGTGGLNDLQAWSVNNIVRIDLYSRPDPNVTEPATPPPYPTNPGGGLVLSIFLQGASWAWTVDYRGVTTGPFVAAVTFGFNTTQIRIQPLGSILPWGAAVVPAQWVMPHSFAAGIRQSLYGLEFAVSINTVSNAGAPAPIPFGSGESNTAWVSPDRLTFNEVIDLRWMKPRGYVHPLSGVPLASSLHIAETRQRNAAGALEWFDLLGYANGGVPFTFLERSTGLGTWVDATVGTVERGGCKVMGFEGYGNTSITGTGMAFSVVPSNADFEGGVICSGSGFTESQFNGNAPPLLRWDSYDNRVTGIAVGAGALANVVPGDILVVTDYPDANYPATSKAGTSLVRHVVEPTGANTYRETLPQTIVGTGSGWCPLMFPKTTEFDLTGNLLTVTFSAGQDPADTFPTPAAGTRVYVVRNVPGLLSADVDTFQEAVVSAEYTGIVSAGTQAVFSTQDYRDSRGNALTAAGFAALLDKSYPISGMAYLPMQVGKEQGLPDNNCVGHHDPTTPLAIFGVAYLTLSTRDFFGVGVTTDLSFDASFGTIVEAPPPGIGQIGVASAAAAAVEDFQADLDTPVYPHVPQEMDISRLTEAQWQSLNVPLGSAGAGDPPANLYIRCLLPGSLVALGDPTGPTAGFYAQGGIFLEPSFPRSTLDLVAAYPRVVDAAHSGTMPSPVGANDEDREFGMRDASRYGSTAAVADPVNFEVRRIRRFHETEVGDSFQALRYAYEMRRGVVTGYTTNNRQRGVLTATAGTTLGLFNDPNVNINPGDLFRLLDSDGTLLESIEIASIESGTRLKLASPGLTTPVVVGKSFEVWLRQAPVPHEQSNEQLLDAISDREVTRTDADWVAETGGFCGAVNQLQDSQKNLVNLGIQPGDIVIIDPMGTIPQVGGLPTTPEQGVRPLGDLGVPARAAWVAGAPSELDDNRGYYRVKKVIGGATPYLDLDPISTFAGGPTSADWVEFGPSGFEYAVYPTISASTLPGQPEEGQMDLRVTHDRDPVTKSFQGTPYSVQPFSYRVIRPSPLFSQEAVDLVLLMRERMLSLMEMLGWGKYGSYFVFQRDQHISDLGSTTDPTDGLGIPSNAYIGSILGEVGEVPYLNNRGSLSLLDRRFWVLDSRLDSLTALNNYQMRLAGPGDTPYTAYSDDALGGGSEVRPVLPDRIDLVLDQTDRFRPIRYIWLAYRVHRILGTLAGIKRYDEELPERLEEQKRLLLLEQTVEKVG